MRIVASTFFSLSSFTSLFLSPQARRQWFRIGFSPLAPWLWYLLCFSFTTGSLAMALSDPHQRHCGWLHFPGCLACTSNTSSQHCALRDRWLAVGATRSCSLQQRVLLTVTSGVRGSLPLRSVKGFQHHSNTAVILWAVSTRITMAYIAACCHGVVLRFLWRVVDPRVPRLVSGFFHWSCHCRTQLHFTCARDFLSCNHAGSTHTFE